VVDFPFVLLGDVEGERTETKIFISAFFLPDDGSADRAQRAGLGLAQLYVGDVDGYDGGVVEEGFQRDGLWCVGVVGQEDGHHFLGGFFAGVVVGICLVGLEVFACHVFHGFEAELDESAGEL